MSNTMRHVPLLLAVVCAPLAGDPTGRWIGHDGKRELVLLLRQDDPRLSGNLIAPMTDFPLEGRPGRSEISFEFQRPLSK